MKKIRFFSAALAATTLITCFAACNDSSVSNGTSATDTTENTIQGVGEYDPALDDSTVTLYESGDYTSLTENYASPSSWVVTDGLGRTVATNADVGDLKEEKYVGIFYSPWHGSFAADHYAYNNQKILDTYPGINKNDSKDDRWGNYGYHFWNEPIYGYYSGKDSWVLRRQAEMLAAAGVDAIICDNTNGTHTWSDTAQRIATAFNEARADGVNAPKIIFHLPFIPGNDTVVQLKELYKRLYSKEELAENWFMWNGKPLILAYAESLDANKREEAEILNYFTFKRGQASYTADQGAPNQWGWLAVYPQTKYTENDRRGEDPEEISVGVAQNYDHVKGGLTAMNGENVTNRTYTSKGYDTRENALLYGANFAEQFDYALEVNPKFVFITGYNEWVSIRQKEIWPDPTKTSEKVAPVENAFADQFDDLNSRDIEPTKGVLKDHYYYQMVDYIRKFKGADTVEDASSPVIIDLDRGYGQWAEVGPRYISYAGNTEDRNFKGYYDPDTGLQLRYTDNSGRNDLYDFKVARDSEYLYFMARCVENITSYTDEKWMHLYLDVNTGSENWETFDYILNKQTPKSQTTAILEKFTGNSFDTTVVGEVEYRINGNVMTVKIPKSMLGIESSEFTVNFKWTDNVQIEGDIMDFYVTGDVAPTGRFKYQYNAK